MRHKHADVIIAFANGKPIQYRFDENGWHNLTSDCPTFYTTFEYRIKPEPKPDVVRFWEARSEGVSVCGSKDGCSKDNLKLTFDGETGELKSAEVI